MDTVEIMVPLNATRTSSWREEMRAREERSERRADRPGRTGVGTQAGLTDTLGTPTAQQGRGTVMSTVPGALPRIACSGTVAISKS